MNTHQVDPFQEVIALFHQGQFELAQQALNKLPIQNNSEYEKKRHVLTCAIAIRSNRAGFASEELEKIIKSYGEDAEIANLKGVAYRNDGHLEKAFEYLKEAVKKYPDSVDINHNLSVTATDLGMLEYAIQFDEKALELNPQFVEAYKNLGRIYVTRRDGDNSKRIFEKLNTIEPNSLDVLVGFGANCLIDDDPESAARYFEKALELNPQNGPSWGNLGLCYKMLGYFDKAKHCLERACAVDPKQIEHPWNLSLIELAMGDYDQGWQRYEVRFDPTRIATDRVVLPKTQVPRLQNQHSVIGKTIVLLQEQGFGDTFQFFRFAKNLKEEGASRIIAINSKELINEVKTIPWIDEVYFELMDTQMHIDYWVYPMSLPARYQIKTPEQIPCPIPYMAAWQDKYQYWHFKLKHLDAQKIKVGLVWAGRETHTNDKNRSMKLSQFEPLKKFDYAVDFISLQKGQRELDTVNNGWQIERMGSQIQDFSDSAGLLANLDLLISIDSAPVHLGGAMGMPVWVLIPYVFDFRWMIDRTDTPWYPSVKLFRQKKAKDWESVISEIEVALTGFIQQHKTRWRPKLLNVRAENMHTPRAGKDLLLHTGFDYHQKGDLQEAINLYAEVRRYEPNNADAIRNMAVIFRAANQIPQALELYEYGARLGFQDSIFYSNYANLLNQLGRDREALEQANMALSLDPTNSYALGIRADYLFNAKLWTEALEEIQKALKIAKRPELLMRATLIHLELKKISEAKLYLEEVLALTGKTLQYHLLAGHVYKDSEEYQQSLAHYDQAIALNPQHYETYMNRAVLKAHMQDYSGAEADARQSLQLDSNNAESHFNLAVYLLTQGKFQEGWQEFEWRMDHRRTAQERVRIPTLSMPMWTGQPLVDKTILIMPEQGYGDYIQFIRYAKYLKQLGAKVIAATPPALENLIKTCPWVDDIALDGQQVTYHYWVFPMSLPHLFKTTLYTIPAETPYLGSNPKSEAYWLKYLKNKGFKKGKKTLIALCWQGASVHRFDHRRSISLEKFTPLLQLKNIEFIGLVKEDGIADEYSVDNHKIINLGSAITDFSDTAAILKNLDLLISIDSAPVHLAGALNVPCWVLLDSMFDYRWLAERTDSPWYPSIKVFRKPLGKSWESVITTILSNLKNLQGKNKKS